MFMLAMVALLLRSPKNVKSYENFIMVRDLRIVWVAVCVC